jgi:hypothetical protein
LALLLFDSIFSLGVVTTSVVEWQKEIKREIDGRDFVDKDDDLQ